MKEYFVRSSQNISGPYSAREVLAMELDSEVEISENGMDGWRSIREYDFKQIVEERDKRKLIAKGIIKKWSWGAFSLNWLWGICNGVYWMIIVLPILFIPKVGVIIGLVIAIYAGMKGREMSWKSGKWGHVLIFKKVQKKWDIVGVILFIALLIVGTGYIIMRLIAN